MCDCDEDSYAEEYPAVKYEDLSLMDKLAWDVYRPAIEAMLKHSIADEFIKE